VTKPKLSNQQIRAFKSQAHALKPVVRVGQHGVTDAVLTELDIALTHHELLKVKISAADRDLREEVIKQLVEKSKATIIQKIGGMLVLYRKNPPAPAKAKSRAGANRKRAGSAKR